MSRLQLSPKPNNPKRDGGPWRPRRARCNLTAGVGFSLRDPAVGPDCLSALIKQPLGAPTLRSGFHTEIWKRLPRASFSPPVATSFVSAWPAGGGRGAGCSQQGGSLHHPTFVLASAGEGRHLRGQESDQLKEVSKEPGTEFYLLFPRGDVFRSDITTSHTSRKQNGVDLMVFFPFLWEYPLIP